MRRVLAGYTLFSAAFLMILALGCAGRAWAQAAAAPASSQPGETQPAVRFNVDSTLVLVPTTVTDTLNRFIIGLQKPDFHLYEDGAEQTITNISGEDVPLSVGLVFDTSSSMADKVGKSRLAALQFLQTMNHRDEAFLVEFSDRAKLAVGFTNQMREIEDELMDVHTTGLTAMLDAAELALRQMKKAKNPRKAILIISDGGDNHSNYTSREIQAFVREADVQIYAMGVFEPTFAFGLSPEEVSGPRLLSELAEQTGGRAFSATDPNDLPSVAARIGIELRNQYVLAYKPMNQEKDGKYRRVEVKVDAPAGVPHVRLHWRLGYYAPSE